LHGIRLTKAVELVKVFSYSKDMADTQKTQDTPEEELDELDSLDFEEGEEEFEDEATVVFTCPNCGVIPRDEVLFICNNCESNEVIYKDGVFVCPQCFYPGNNFECMRCGNKQVVGKFS
jgi:hypothetical protein